MATFTLDHFRQAAAAKYGSTDIELGEGDVLSLINPLRLSKDKRKSLTEIQENAEDRDQGDVMRDALRLVASDSEKCERFLDIVGDDLAMLATVFEAYTDGSQMGEASASQD